MEVKGVLGKITTLISKYRYAACILLIGIVLMLLPSGKQDERKPAETIETVTSEITVEQQLGALLSKIQGAGRVEVMLSYAYGAETRYQTDTESDNGGSRVDTVIITDTDKNQSGLITRVDPPVYQGAIVLCQGADSASVRLAIVDAVSKYTGLGADQISVLKMK